MPIPAVALTAAKLAALLPLLLKGGKAATRLGKAAYASKSFWPAALGGTFLGSEVLGQYGKAGERGVAREEIALQKFLAEASAEVAMRGTKESKKQTEKYLQELMKSQREEQKAARESELMQSFLASQDRQIALVLQAMQGISTQATGIRPGDQPGGGMVGIMRSNI